MINMSIPDDGTENFVKSLWKSEGTVDMPENFKRVLTYFSVNKDFDIAVREWFIIPHEGESNTRCICSHNIIMTLFIKNKYTGSILRVGSECIKKFFPQSIADVVDEVILRQKALLKETGRRWCGGCKRHNILPDKPIYTKLCNKCWKSGIRTVESVSDTHFNRQCEGCKQYNIPKTEPEWKKVCFVCYKNTPKVPRFTPPNIPSRPCTLVPFSHPHYSFPKVLSLDEAMAQLNVTK